MSHSRKAQLLNSVHILFLLSFFLTTAFPFLAYAGWDANQAACLEKRAYLTKKMKATINLNDLILKTVDSSSNVIFLGVEHFNFEKEIYPALAKEIKSRFSDLDCFFIEETLGDKEQKTLDIFNNGGQISTSELTEAVGLNRAEIFQELHKIGLKIFYVDQPGANNINLGSDHQELDWLNNRDNFMSGFISSLKASGQCQKAFYPIGFNHLVKAQNRINLKNKLNGLNLKTSELLFLVAGRNSSGASSGMTINPSWIWQKSFIQGTKVQEDNLLCPDVPNTPKGFSAFLNSPSSAPVGYLPNSQSFIGTYGEFKGTIIYSCADTACVKENEDFTKNLKRTNVEIY